MSVLHMIAKIMERVERLSVFPYLGRR